MEYDRIRSYEVSVWTLQDEFITVLKHSNLENKGQIEEGIVELNIDGTQNISFKIPMYLEPNVENPCWYNVSKGVLLANMRKLKVIFNKQQPEEKVFEFVITNVEETHENDQVYCNVQGEGLAFQELGKRGYKLSYSPDDFYEDATVKKWYDGTEAYQNSHTEPIANIQWWLNKFMTKLPSRASNIVPQKWYYTLQMDWSSFPGAENLSSSTIYDEEYITTWTVTKNGDEITGLTAGTVEPPKEKARMIDIKESNIYNITQQLAEVFGVFCRYEFTHDGNYHITSRRVVFYNNFYSEKLGFLDFTYPYSTEQVRRIQDGADLVTKLYVKNIEDSTTSSGLISILDAEPNPSKEDYILNFDYLYEIGTITKEQYDDIKVFEAQMRDLNDQIDPVERKLIALEDEMPKLNARLTTAKNGVKQATERITDCIKMNALLTAESKDGTIKITSDNPAQAYLLQDSNVENPNYYYIQIREKGVIAKTVRIYRNYDYTGKTLSNQIKSGTPQYDDYGNLIRLNNIYCGSDSQSVYLTYSYRPTLYYDNIKKIWQKKLAKDRADVTSLKALISEKKAAINAAKTQKTALIAQKEQVISDFEEEMGPAIREGYWQPENYTDYGNKLIDNIHVNLGANIVQGNTPFASFVWDTQAFDGEEVAYYELGIDQTKYYYPCIKLTDSDLGAIKDHLDDLSFCFFDYQYTTNTEQEPMYQLKCLALGSQCQLVFIHENNSSNTFPAILLTGEKALNTEEDSNQLLKRMKKSGFIGKLTTSIETVDGKATIVTNAETYISNSNLNSSHWISLTDNVLVPHGMLLAYPRIKITSSNLKVDSNLGVAYNGNKLEEFKDYSVLNRVDNDDIGYYITLKPEVLVKEGLIDKNIGLQYTISTASTAIYLDALQVSRENAYPQVSYEIDPNIYGETFMHIAYNTLGTLAHINDTKLKFQNVMGYISKVELNLDKPWEDTIEIQNYKNKFEDLFSTIVAQTEAMKAIEPVLSSAAGVLTLDGTIAASAVKNALRKVDLDYAFNNGALTISEENGIWGTSDSGVVAYRGGGIFTATEKDGEGNWEWNTGITPEGINADLITTGQLDTNLIRIFAGDDIKFQMNGDGIFAYHSLSDSLNQLNRTNAAPGVENTLNNLITANKSDNLVADLDLKQYVKYDSNGLFLVAEQGAYALNSSKTDFATGGPLSRTVNRVEISWDGLVLRNWDNNRVFYADPDTGNLHITGDFVARSLKIGDVDLDNIGSDINNINQNIDDIGKNINNLNGDIEDINDTITDIDWDLIDINGNIKNINGDITSLNTNITNLQTNINGKTQTFIQTSYPVHPFKKGDIWQKLITSTDTGYLYVATENSTGVVSHDNGVWVPVEAFRISGTKLIVDTQAGIIDIQAENRINIASGGLLNIYANGALNIQGAGGVNILAGSGLDMNGTLTLTSGGKFIINSGGDFTISSGGKFSLTSTNFRVTPDGTIYAFAGQVGGWELKNKILLSGSGTNNVGMSANIAKTGNISYSTTIPKGNNTDQVKEGYYAFWAGNEDPNLAPFRVTRDGTVFVDRLIAKETIDDGNGGTTIVYNYYTLSNTNSSGGGGGSGGSSGGSNYGGSVDLHPTDNMSLTSGWSGNTYTARMYYKGSQRSTQETTYTGTKFSYTGAEVRNNYYIDLTAAAEFEGDGGNWTTNYISASVDASLVYNSVSPELSSQYGKVPGANDAPQGWTYWPSSTNGKEDTSNMIYVPKYTPETTDTGTKIIFNNYSSYQPSSFANAYVYFDGEYHTTSQTFTIGGKSVTFQQASYTASRYAAETWRTEPYDYIKTPSKYE